MCEPSHLLPIAATAERTGWYGVTVPDSVFFPEKVEADYPYTFDGERFWTGDTPFVDPWVAIPAMAAVTQDLFFHTSVLKLPIRNPLLVAKTVGSAAALSGDRVGLGVGLSWIPEEFEWCGTDFATRGPRANESIEAIRALLQGGMVEYHGEHYDFDRLQMSPAPGKPVPIYVGGHARPALRRAARLGDGWISANKPASEITRCIGEINAMRAEAGRDREPFEMIVICTDAFDADGVRRLEDAGVTEAIFVPWMLYGGDTVSLDVRKAGLERFANDVIAKMD